MDSKYPNKEPAVFYNSLEEAVEHQNTILKVSAAYSIGSVVLSAISGDPTWAYFNVFSIPAALCAYKSRRAYRREMKIVAPGLGEKL